MLWLERLKRKISTMLDSKSRKTIGEDILINQDTFVKHLEDLDTEKLRGRNKAEEDDDNLQSLLRGAVRSVNWQGNSG